MEERIRTCGPEAIQRGEKILFDIRTSASKLKELCLTVSVFRISIYLTFSDIFSFEILQVTDITPAVFFEPDAELE